MKDKYFTKNVNESGSSLLIKAVGIIEFHNVKYQCHWQSNSRKFSNLVGKNLIMIIILEQLVANLISPYFSLPV